MRQGGLERLRRMYVSARLRKRSAAARAVFQPRDRFVVAAEDPGIESSGTQVLLRRAVDRLHWPGARYERELEVGANRRAQCHGLERIAQAVMPRRIVVAGLQQRAIDLLVDAQNRKGAVDVLELCVVAAVEIDPHVSRAFGNAAVVGHDAAALFVLGRADTELRTDSSVLSPSGFIRKRSKAASASVRTSCRGDPVTATSKASLAAGRSRMRRAIS